MIGEGEHLRLAGIGLRAHADQARDAGRESFGLDHRGPLRDPIAHLVCRYVFRNHYARCAPIALQGIGISKILAHLRGILARTQCIAEYVDTLVRTTCERNGETKIGRIEHAVE